MSGRGGSSQSGRVAGEKAKRRRKLKAFWTGLIWEVEGKRAEGGSVVWRRGWIYG